MNALKIDNLCFAYDDRPILNGLNLEIAPESFWAIVGPNGCGKSTLLSLIAGLLTADSGHVFIHNKPIRNYSRKELCQKLAIVRQEFIPAFEFTVRQTVMMSRVNNHLMFESQIDQHIVNEALKATETIEFADRTLAQLSGGERQRVFIARALAQQTPILLLDEPMNHLDLKHQVAIYDMLKKMQRELDKTILLITHDINLAAQYCDNVLLMGTAGVNHCGNPSQVFTEKRLKEIFGVSGYLQKINGQNVFLPMGKLARGVQKTQK